MSLSSRIALSLVLLWPVVAAGKVTKVEVSPSFETAGVIVTVDGDALAESVTLEVQGPAGDYRPAHPFVPYDGQHLATSLFDLKPGTRYTLRLGDGTTQSFTTRRSLGSPPAPLRTVNVSTTEELSSALENAEPGDLILLAAGSYTGGLTMSKSGSAEHPIVIRGEVPAAELAKPIEEREGLPVIENGGEEAGLKVSASYVWVENLRVRNNKDGVRLSAASYCVVQYCQVYDNGDWANILIDHGGPETGHNVIQYNHVADLEHNNPFTIEYECADSTQTYYGIRVDDDPGCCMVIRYNRIEQQCDGITPCPDEENTQEIGELDSDVLAGAEEKRPAHDIEVYGNMIVDQRDDSIEADGLCVNARIHHNFMKHSGGGISIAPALPGPYFFVRNLLVDFVDTAVKLNTRDGRGTIRNHYFYHNTMTRKNDGESEENATFALYDGTPSKNIFFTNNIFTNESRLMVIQDSWDHHPTMDYNLWYSNQGASAKLFVRWGGSGFSCNWEQWKSRSGDESNGLFGNPLLNSELCISEGSPAIDKGLVIPGINDGASGAGPDIGHYELGQPVPVFGTQVVEIESPPLPDGGSSGSDGGGGGDGSSGPQGDGGSGEAKKPGARGNEGCDCAVASSGDALGFLLLLAALALAWRRRR